jgi:tetratricopeptide (TPR) repeat protein
VLEISPGIMKEVPSTSSSPGVGSRALAEARYYDAVDSLAANDIPAAIAGFRSSLEADPGYTDAAHGLLHALKADGQFDEAIAVAQRLIASNPDDVLAHTSLSILYQHQGKIAEAESAATRAKLLGWKHELRQHKEAEGQV